MSKLHVYDAETDELLGEPAPDLVKCCLVEGGDGCAAAWKLPTGKWTHECQFTDVREVYVAKEPETLNGDWRADAPKYTKAEIQKLLK